MVIVKRSGGNKQIKIINKKKQNYKGKQSQILKKMLNFLNVHVYILGLKLL